MSKWRLKNCPTWANPDDTRLREVVLVPPAAAHQREEGAGVYLSEVVDMDMGPAFLHRRNPVEVRSWTKMSDGFDLADVEFVLAGLEE